MPHRDDLEVALARIAALERDKAALEARLEKREVRTELAVAQPIEIVKVDNRTIATQRLSLAREVDKNDLVEAIESEPGFDAVALDEDDNIHWEGCVDGRNIELVAIRRRGGVVLRAEYTTGVETAVAVGALALTLAALVVLGLFVTDPIVWIVAPALWFAGAISAYDHLRSSRARANDELEATFDRIRGRLAGSTSPR